MNTGNPSKAMYFHEKWNATYHMYITIMTYESWLKKPEASVVREHSLAA
jgi:hypothetical protein